MKFLYIIMGLQLILANDSFAGSIKKKKEVFPKEYYAYRSNVLDTMAELIKAGFDEAGIKNANTYGVDAKNFSRKLKLPKMGGHGKMNMVQNTSGVATFISRMSRKDWKAQSLKDLYDNKTIFWVDRKFRQHAASFDVNWWFSDEPILGEYYVNLSLKKLWIENGPKDKKEFSPKKSSRQITYTVKKVAKKETKKSMKKDVKK